MRAGPVRAMVALTFAILCSRTILLVIHRKVETILFSRQSGSETPPTKSRLDRESGYRPSSIALSATRDKGSKKLGNWHAIILKRTFDLRVLFDTLPLSNGNWYFIPRSERGGQSNGRTTWLVRARHGRRSLVSMPTRFSDHHKLSRTHSSVSCLRKPSCRSRFQVVVVVFF